MKKVALVYHKVDYDGLFSCCIARKALLEKYTDIELIGFTYGDPIPDLTGHDLVVMVDISLPLETMKWLGSEKECIWIDHHQTALDQATREGYSGMGGLRRIGTGACELCWEYFYGEWKCPKLIQYLSAYDVWNKDKFDWNSEVVPLQLILRTKYGMSLQKIWDAYNTLVSSRFLPDLMEQGKLIAEYEANQFRAACKSYAFPVTVNEGYKGICIMTNSFGSRIFEPVIDQYDIYITVNRKVDPVTGKITFPVGLYCEPGRIPFSLGEYVQQKYGPDRGGGHACACGTSLTPDEFAELVIGCKI